MPLEAKIFYVEDSNASRETCTEFLNKDGHTIVEIATTTNEAIGKISGLKEKGVNIVILDGNLIEGEERGEEGEFIAREIKKQHPDIIVIGHSLINPIKSANINCPKLEGVTKLVEVVRNA